MWDSETWQQPPTSPERFVEILCDGNVDIKRKYLHRLSSLPNKPEIKRGIDLIKGGVDFFDVGTLEEDVYEEDLVAEVVSTDDSSCYENEYNDFAEQERKFPLPMDCDIKSQSFANELNECVDNNFPLPMDCDIRPQSFANELSECVDKIGTIPSSFPHSTIELREDQSKFYIERQTCPGNVPPSRSSSDAGKHQQLLLSNLFSLMENSEFTRAEVQKLDLSLAKKVISTNLK